MTMIGMIHSDRAEQMLIERVNTLVNDGDLPAEARDPARDDAASWLLADSHPWYAKLALLYCKAMGRALVD